MSVFLYKSGMRSLSVQPKQRFHLQLHDEVEVRFVLIDVLQRNNVGVFNPVGRNEKEGQR